MQVPHQRPTFMESTWPFVLGAISNDTNFWT